MDNVTAVLLGAVVGSLSTVAAAVAGPAIAARVVTKREVRREVRVEIANVLHALLMLASGRREAAPNQRALHADVVTAATRLSVLLGPRESELERAIDFTLGMVANDGYAAGILGVGALRSVLHAWYRGEIRGSKVGPYYAEELKRIGDQSSD